MLPLAALAPAVAATGGAASEIQAKARAAAREFEAVFLNTMLQPMFSARSAGPFGGGPGSEIWRSLLTDEYAKSFARSGGIGIADHVYQALIALQEGRAAHQPGSA
jgi:Rod binding domain-containing protein